jgi:hypothetical protein
MQSALEKASPGDLVQLSDQALQLQQVGLLFGNLDGTQSTGLPSASDNLFSVLSPGGSDPGSNLMLQALESSLSGGASSAISSATAATATTASGQLASTSAPLSLANQIANTASNSQLQEMDALFGIAPAVDPSLNMLG